MIIAMNRFVVKQEFADSFEERWRKRQSHLQEAPGFLRFRLLKSLQKDAVEFVSHSEWRNGKDFQSWLDGDLSKKAHSGAAPVGDMFTRPPEFRIYEIALDEVLGHRTDARSATQDDIVANAFAHESTAQLRMRQQGLVRGLPPINIGPFEGRLIEILLRSNNSKNGLEIGTLGGYSASWIARAIPADGKLTTLEKSENNAAIAAELLAEAGLSNKVEIKVGDALETLNELSHLKDLDFVFIDADKANYGNYVEWAIPRLRKGGLLLVDNAYIWGGMLYFGGNPEKADLEPHASRSQFDGMSDCWRQMAAHDELASLIFATGDGLGVAVKTT